MKRTITIEVKNIKVGFRFYSFDYRVTTNGKARPWRGYDNYYSNQTAKHFKKVLQKGYAFDIVFNQL